jgi:hypothetical protein
MAALYRSLPLNPAAPLLWLLFACHQVCRATSSTARRDLCAALAMASTACACTGPAHVAHPARAAAAPVPGQASVPATLPLAVFLGMAGMTAMSCTALMTAPTALHAPTVARRAAARLVGSARKGAACSVAGSGALDAPSLEPSRRQLDPVAQPVAWLPPPAALCCSTQGPFALLCQQCVCVTAATGLGVHHTCGSKWPACVLVTCVLGSWWAQACVRSSAPCSSCPRVLCFASICGSLVLGLHVVACHVCARGLQAVRWFTSGWMLGVPE